MKVKKYFKPFLIPILFLPLLERPFQRSIPLRRSAILASSTNVSEMLKFTKGDTSKNPIEFLSAYSSASS